MDLSRLAPFVKVNPDSDISVTASEDIPVSERDNAELLERVVGVGQQLAQEDILVRIEGVDNQ